MISRVATANPLWKMQSTHSLSVPGGARKGRLSVGQWAYNSLLTRWSLSCSSLNRYGCSSSHSSPRGSNSGEIMLEFLLPASLYLSCTPLTASPYCSKFLLSGARKNRPMILLERMYMQDYILKSSTVLRKETSSFAFYLKC